MGCGTFSEKILNFLHSQLRLVQHNDGLGAGVKRHFCKCQLCSQYMKNKCR